MLEHIYKTSLALLTDLYQLTMAQGYWRLGIQDKMSCFHLFFRKKPFEGSYAIFAGLETAIDFINQFHFDTSDIEYLSSIEGRNGSKLFDKGFLKYLKSLRLKCDIHSVEEGNLVFPYEPLVRVTGPLLHAQLLESPLLNLINFQTLIATKAARIVSAAYPDQVVEFGVRRAQGIDGAISATRAAFLGGCHFTSNVLGGKLFGIPVSGTHSHSWVMAHESEKDAFENFSASQPYDCVFLIDTYNTLKGAEIAIDIAKRMEAKNQHLLALRLDSGDLASLSIIVRKMLDKAGLKNVKIMATNELDEKIIRDLKHQGAKVNFWGVGTNLVTGKEQPALDGVYKLAAIQNSPGIWEHKLKISDSFMKVTDPGILQIKRFENEQGAHLDIIYDELTGLPKNPTAIDPIDPARVFNTKYTTSSCDLLKTIYREGLLVYQSPSLKKIRKSTQENLKKFAPSIRRFLYPHPYSVGLEEGLYQKKIKIIREINSI